MLRRVALLRTDVSEERITSIIMVTRIGELGKMLVVTSNRSTLRRNSTHSCETSVLTRATRRNNLEEGILHSHRRETSDLTRNFVVYAAQPVFL
jgi:hypothetical protein